MATVSDWRAQVEKDLKGVPFEKALVSNVEGVRIEPLYTRGPVVRVPGMPDAFLICADGKPGELEAVEVKGDHWPVARHVIAARLPESGVDAQTRFTLLTDPLSAEFPALAAQVDARFQHGCAATISTIGLHDDGAEPADELAVTLATAVAALKATDLASRQLAVRIAVGRDTFVELAKLRALRVVWDRLMNAAGFPSARLHVHALCSSRTLTQRDPWVNMLRTTTQMFAAILGGADVITPTAFDQELAAQSELGARVARNTGLVLRHESALGQVVDPAGGAWFLDTLTDQLAREGWKRFQAIEAEGGIRQAFPAVRARIADAWTKRLAALASRKTPVLGVSEFPNLAERLPASVRPFGGPGHRDAEAFERLRAANEGRSRTVTLGTLGSFADSRARVTFATSFFGAGGFAVSESEVPVAKTGASELVCLCGPDDAYASSVVERAKELKASGWKRVLVAGRPGANETAWRAAGVDGFIFLGADLIATLEAL